MENNRVIHFEIQADDIERATHFYQKTLGWEIKQYMKKEEGFMDYWGIVTGDKNTPGINGGLYQRPEKGEKHYLFDCTVTVKDIDKTIQAVKDNGGTIIKDKTEMKGLGWFAACKDTEGNKFGLMQPTEWKPS